jgi:hypothetical protein
MAKWNMNTLVFHFSDDSGTAIKLKGFEEFALENAFTTKEISHLIDFAKNKGVEIIPELEVFGHTKYITNTPKFSYLYVGSADLKSEFNAIDPLHPDTILLMEKLINIVADVFPSDYFHLGCDEVDLTAYSSSKKLDKDKLWVDYVNLMAKKVKIIGKKPMIWADHVANTQAWIGRNDNDALISEYLDKDIILIDWRYEEDIKDDVIKTLQSRGFKNIVAAPSLACYRYRFFPTCTAFKNTDKMTRFALQNNTMGVINTIWHPARYIQGSLYYGIAYSAEVVNNAGLVDIKSFQNKFAEKVFATPLTDHLKVFWDHWLKIDIRYDLLQAVVNDSYQLTEEQLNRLKKIYSSGIKAILAADNYSPTQGQEIWNSFVLSARIAWLFSLYCLKMYSGDDKPKMLELKKELEKLQAEIDADWNKTRFEDSPQKYRNTHAAEHTYVIPIITTMSNKLQKRLMA